MKYAFLHSLSLALFFFSFFAASFSCMQLHAYKTATRKEKGERERRFSKI